MKLRPTLLFLAIFMSIGIWADTSITVDTEHPLTSVSQISTSKYYVLKNVGHNAYMNVNSSTGLVQITSELPTTDEGLLPFIVRFEVNTAAKSDGSAYQVKFYDGTYLPWESQGKENYCSRTKGYNGSENEGYLPVYDTDHFYFQVYKGGTSRNQYFNGNSLNSGTGSFTFWDSMGGNSRYQVYEATCSNFQENNYKFSCEGKTTNFGKLLTVKSASFAHPVSFYVDDDLLVYPATAPSDGSDITISMSYPFITTSLVDGNFPANTPLYRLKGNVGNTPKYVKHTSGSVAYKEDNDITNDDYFCFTGNPIDGFKIYNIGAGTSVNLGSDTPAQGTAPALTSKNHVWRIYKNNNVYGLQQIKTDNTRVSNAYLCNVGSTFTYWIDSAAESTNDNGSRMLIEPVTFDVTYNVLDKPDGTPVASAIGAMTTGGDMTLSVPSSAARGFCTYTFYSDAACTSEVTSTVMGGVSTVYALYTFNPPFKVSSSYEDATWYYLKLKNAYYPKYVSDGTPNVTSPSGHSEDDSDAMWAFMGNPYDGFQIINKSAGDSFVLGSESAAGDGNTGGNTYATLGTSGSQTYERWFVSSNSAYTNGFAIANAQGHALNQRSTANLAYWTSSSAFSNDGSAFVAEGVPFNVTYSVRYEPSGSEVATSIVSKTTADDLTLSLPSSIARDFCTYTYYSDLAMTNEITSASFARGITTVYAKPTWEGPFEISADFENAHWYDMAVRGNYYVTSGRSDGNGALAPVEANALGLVEDDYQWAFVGDPYAGFKMFNKGQGSSKAYAWTSNGNASIPAFVDEGSANVWTIKASTASGYTNAFLLTIPDYGYQVNQFGGASGSLKIWQDTGTHDAGSSFQVFDVPDDFSGYVTSEIAPYMENDATYFNWTDEARAGIGYDSSYKTSCTYSKYSELKSNLTTALGSISANVNYPPTGYYRMLSANYENRYIGCTSGGLTTAVSADDKNVSTIVYLEEVDPVAHTYHVSMQGGNIVSISKSAQIVLSSSNPTLLAASVTTIGAGTFNRTEGDEYGAMHCGSNNGYNVVGWTVSSDASQWIPEDVSTSVVTLNSDGAGTYYATLCVPFSYTVSDATAYTLERSGSWLIPTAVEGAVPAGTPVVLKGTSSTATLTISGTDYAATPTDDTALTGTYLAKTIDGATDYVFGKKDGVVGFYHWDSNDLGANRAYVDTPVVGVKGFALLFDEEETAIANVNINGNGNNAAIYNMAGQKLSKLQKGINIVNGKKVLY